MELIEQKLTIRPDTHNYTKKDILDEIEECRAILLSLGYESVGRLRFSVKIAKNLSKTMGRCHQNVKDRDYTIIISDKAIKYASPERLHNIVIHEIIHALPGAMNHGPVWKSYADAVNRNYKYTPIQRVSSDQEYHENFYDNYRAGLVKYIVECAACGSKWKYKRMCDTVKACKSGRAKCSCGGRTFYIQNLT